MPKTTVQKVIFGLLMSFFMVLAMELYNTGLRNGGLTNAGILEALGELPLMLVLPLVLVVVMSVMGSGFLDSLFTTALGRGAATVGVICTFVSYVLASRAAEIQV